MWISPGAADYVQVYVLFATVVHFRRPKQSCPRWTLHSELLNAVRIISHLQISTVLNAKTYATFYATLGRIAIYHTADAHTGMQLNGFPDASLVAVIY